MKLTPRLYFLLIFSVLSLCSCEKRELNNPFDEDCPKELFTPTNFSIKQVGDRFNLSWEQSNKHISGFVINRNEDDGNMMEIARIEKLDTIWQDTNFTGGKKYGYQLFAFAGENLSNPQLAHITAVVGPEIVTLDASDILHNAATLGGNIIDDGGSAITERGICYKTTPDPTIADGKVEMGKGKGVFNQKVANLTESTTYYVKAYAINSNYISYGNQISFTTSKYEDTGPAVTTHAASNISRSSAVLGGIITSDGGSAVTERGVCVSTVQNPTLGDQKHLMGTGTGAFSQTISGLSEKTEYFVRAYGINTQDTTYGNQISFITTETISGQIEIITAEAKDVTISSADLGGEIIVQEGVHVGMRGICFSTQPTPTLEDRWDYMGYGPGVFSDSVAYLGRNTTYYVRAFCESNEEVIYGNEISFTTLSTYSPTATTLGTDNVTPTTATLHGYVKANGHNTNVIFEYGINSQFDVTVIPEPNSVSGYVGEYINAEVSGLYENTIYQVRVKATNEEGTVYSEPTSFITWKSLVVAETGSISDIEGNTYNTVKLGDQWWMTENLKTTKLNDGTDILNETRDLEWMDLEIPAYCWYDNQIGNKQEYGALYNYYAVNTGKLCPSGWHVPSNLEFDELIDYYGGRDVAGRVLMDAEFKAQLAGSRYIHPGLFGLIDGVGDLWTSNLDSQRIFKSRNYIFLFSGVNRYYGFSVRCVKD